MVKERPMLKKLKPSSLKHKLLKVIIATKQNDNGKTSLEILGSNLMENKRMNWINDLKVHKNKVISWKLTSAYINKLEWLKAYLIKKVDSFFNSLANNPDIWQITTATKHWKKATKIGVFKWNSSDLINFLFI